MRKKAVRETQTLRAGCSKAEPKIFAPPQTPSRGRWIWPKFNHLEIVTTFTHRPSLVRIDARNLGVIVVTDPQTNTPTNTQTNPHTQTHRQDRLQHTVPQLASAQCNDNRSTGGKVFSRPTATPSPPRMSGEIAQQSSKVFALPKFSSSFKGNAPPQL